MDENDDKIESQPLEQEKQGEELVYDEIDKILENNSASISGSFEKENIADSQSTIIYSNANGCEIKENPSNNDKSPNQESLMETSSCSNDSIVSVNSSKSHISSSSIENEQELNEIGTEKKFRIEFGELAQHGENQSFDKEVLEENEKPPETEALENPLNVLPEEEEYFEIIENSENDNKTTECNDNQVNNDRLEIIFPETEPIDNSEKTNEVLEHTTTQQQPPFDNIDGFENTDSFNPQELFKILDDIEAREMEQKNKVLKADPGSVDTNGEDSVKTIDFDPWKNREASPAPDDSSTTSIQYNSILDDHYYLNSQTIIDLCNDDSQDVEMFTEIREKLNESDNDNSISAISKFSKIIIENFARTSTDRQLIRCLKNFANIAQSNIKVEMEETMSTDSLDAPQFKLLSEEPENVVIVENPEVDQHSLNIENELQTLTECPVAVLESREEKLQNIPEIKMEFHLEEEGITESHPTAAISNEDGPLEGSNMCESTVEAKEISMQKDQELCEMEVNEQNKEHSVFEDRIEQNEQNTNSDEVKLESTHDDTQEKSSLDIHQDLKNSDEFLIEVLNQTMAEIENDQKIIEIPESIGQPSELLKNFAIENLNEMDVSQNVEVESSERPLSPRQIEVNNKLSKVKNYVESFTKGFNEIEAETLDTEKIDDFLKNNFKTFRNLLVELNLRKIRRKEIEKIKKALINESSSSSNVSSSDECESESENKPSEHRNNKNKEILKELTENSDQDIVPEIKLNEHEEREEESSEGVMETDSSDTDKEINR